MIITLIPLKTTSLKVDINRKEVLRRLSEVPSGCNMLVFPELTLTGYIHDLKEIRNFAEELNGPTTEFFRKIALKLKTWIAFSFIEKARDSFYVCGILLDDGGKIQIHHRKIAERGPYSVGSGLVVAKTPFGKTTILLCGDIFLKDIGANLADDLDLLIVPMNRSFEGRSPDAERWEREERKAYIDAARPLARNTVVCNALSDGSENLAFGGALWVNREGGLIGESSHGTDNALVVNL